jgi:Mrp family chromosome partitioning ATPase
MFGPDRLNPFSEAFKLIKRNIYRHAVEDRATVVLVISASKEDGKTTVAANIAKSLADDGKRVVLVDCDVYLSRIQGMPSFAGAPGLSDWMATGERPKLMAWPDEKFTLLPAGSLLTPRSERLGEHAFETVMKALGEEFDYIVLDSPPLPIVSDGLTLGGFADLILSVVSVANTARRAFAQHNELIEALSKPHGIIINGADTADFEASEAYFLGSTSRWNKFTGWFRVG